jgi:hypothetical protein
MSPNSLPRIGANGCEHLGGLSHHPMAEMTNTKNEKNKNACQVVVLHGSMANQTKGIHKTC